MVYKHGPTHHWIQSVHSDGNQIDGYLGKWSQGLTGKRYNITFGVYGCALNLLCDIVNLGMHEFVKTDYNKEGIGKSCDITIK